jgi:phenylalanyl-tRNA synthetase beta chain
MTFSYNWLQSFFEKKLPKPEELAELLTRHAFEVSEVKKVSGDFVLDIDVLSNRGHDCLCHLGMARELSVILEQKLISQKCEKLRTKKGELKPIELKINCPGLVLRYSALLLEGVKISQSPQWLKKRLETVGIRSINNIVDLTNFVMMELGQPLHVFDYDKILGQKMILRKSKKGEEVITLDGVARTLDEGTEGTLVIEDKDRLIDLVGIMGGKLSEIDSKTKNIVLQAGNFDRRSIYQATKKLRHFTDAANIYIHGIDPNLTIPALERVYFLLKKLGAEKITQVIDIYPQKVLPKKIKLDLDYVEKLLGMRIPEKEIKNILRRLGFKITHQLINSSTHQLLIEVPTFRLDISIPEDLIEEIGRIYGYQKIKSAFPTAALIPPKRNLKIFWEDRVKDILKEAGFTEVYNYSFISEDAQRIFGNGNLVELENPISLDFKYLRPSLIPNLVKNVKKNQAHFAEMKIFELGKTFRKLTTYNLQLTTKNLKVIEKKMLTAVITSEAFYQLKGVVDLLLEKLGISNAWYDEYQPTPEESQISLWHPKKCAEIKIGQEEIGFLGEISSGVLENLKIAGKVVVFDIDFEKLEKLASEEHEYQPISSYPAAIRDIAILVSRNVRVEEVLNVIETAGGKLIRDIDLFDIYEGEEIQEGKKNLAFHIIYQAEDRTLSSEEIDNIQQKIIAALEENPEWEVRK